MPAEPQVPGEGVLLRPYRAADADDVAAACDDALTQRFVPGLPRPYTRADAEWWITTGAPDAAARGGYAYAIADPGSGRLLGGIGVARHRPAEDPGSAEIGYWVAPWARGRGVATAATRALAGYAFGAGVARLELRTAWENAASQRVALGAGFVREAVARAAGVGRGGDRYDQLVWVRLAGDPGTPTPRLLPDLPGPGAPPDRCLADGVVCLRPLGPADAADTYALRREPDVYARSVPPVPPSAGDVTQACERAGARWLAGETAALTVRDAGSGAYLGEIALFYQEPVTGQAMLGYGMAASARGRGYATRATRLVAAWAFDQAGIERLIAGTAPDNVGSQRVLERAGFRREGFQRARLPGGPGQPRVDDILYALLPDDPTA
ncbi:GNAT family N-acetyltransferase [Luedemannella helvata]|uniref:N-acetyltransferase domain-containing protein n=1 Tax=Luedemannella helvata TaxID=349315 RepID=A0ABP4W507_9ACTN